MKVTLTAEITDKTFGFDVNDPEMEDNLKYLVLEVLYKNIALIDVDIELCNCDYPNVKLRNMSCHAMDCPTHIKLMKMINESHKR